MKHLALQLASMEELRAQREQMLQAAAAEGMAAEPPEPQGSPPAG